MNMSRLSPVPRPQPASMPAPSAKTKRRTRRGIERRRQIVQAAAAVFAEFGYSGGTIRTIAECVGASPATLIQHFGSKQGLLAAVLGDWANQVDGLIPADLRGLAHIRAMSQLVAYHAEHRGRIELFLTMTAEASNSSHPARLFIQDHYANTLADFRDHLLEAVVDGEIAQLSDAEVESEIRLLTAVLNGVELQWLLDPGVDIVGIVDGYLDATVERWRRGLIAGPGQGSAD